MWSVVAAVEVVAALALRTSRLLPLSAIRVASASLAPMCVAARQDDRSCARLSQVSVQIDSFFSDAFRLSLNRFR